VAAASRVRKKRSPLAKLLPLRSGSLPGLPLPSSGAEAFPAPLRSGAEHPSAET